MQAGHRHGWSPDKAALFGSVHEVAGRGLLNAEAMGQFSDRAGLEVSMYIARLELERGMAVGDPRVDARTGRQSRISVAASKTATAGSYRIRARPSAAAFQRGSQGVPPGWLDPRLPQQMHIDIRVSSATPHTGNFCRWAPNGHQPSVRPGSESSPIQSGTRSASSSDIQARAETGLADTDRPMTELATSTLAARVRTGQTLVVPPSKSEMPVRCRTSRSRSWTSTNSCREPSN